MTYMLAMAAMDTPRHRDVLVAREFGADDRDQQLIVAGRDAQLRNAIKRRCVGFATL